MEQPLANKKILIVEDEVVFRSIMVSYLTSLGAEVTQAENGLDALLSVDDTPPDLILCDLAMPEMDGIELIENLRLQGIKTPILIISATDKMTDIDKVLRLGVQDVLLKPIKDLNRLRESVLSCLYPRVFTSAVIEEIQLINDWDELAHYPGKAAALLKQLQPPVQQNIGGCRVNYRQLMRAEESGLVLDTAALSNQELGFYCVDVTQVGNRGVLAALLLRSVFNRLLQEHLANQKHRLPQMSALLKQLNKLFHQSNLEGQYPLLVGYYHTGYKNLILVSAGLHALVSADNKTLTLDNSLPLGTLDNAYMSQITLHCDEWDCQIWSSSARLRLMVTPESE